MLRQKLKQMIAMSTVITVVTAAAMQLKIDSGEQKMVQELYKQMESDSNYPTIPSTHHQNAILNELDSPKDISNEWRSSKLVQLLDHLLLMNTCVTNNHRLSYQTTYSKPNKTYFQNSSVFKSIIYFNYLTTANYTS